MNKVSEIILSEEYKGKNKLDIFLLPNERNLQEILETEQNFYILQDTAAQQAIDIHKNLFVIPKEYNMILMKYDMIFLCGRSNPYSNIALEMRKHCSVPLVVLEDMEIISDQTSPQIISWIKQFQADVNICTKESIAKNLLLEEAIIFQTNKTMKENLETLFKGYRQNEA